MRLLYVEDDRNDADLFQRKLKKESPQSEIRIADTLRHARNSLKKSAAYDAVIIDLSLPDGNGLELLKEIRADSLPLPAIILTGTGDEAAVVAAFKAGADDYLIKKPGYLDQLSLTLEAAISRFFKEKAKTERQITVLYVGQKTADMELIHRHLTRYAPHINLKANQSTDEARELIEQTRGKPEKFDLLLLECSFIGAAEFDIVKALRRDYKTMLPVILLTDKGNEDSAINALRLGASDYVVKHSGYLHQLPTVLESAFYHSELIREQAALRESEHRFRSLVENAQDIMFRLQLIPEKCFEYLSPAVTAIGGYTPEEYYADFDLLFRTIHAESRDGLKAALRGEARYNAPLALKFTKKDEGFIWLEFWSLPKFNQAGRLVSLEGVARDITGRKQAEEALRESEMLKGSIIDAIPDILLRFRKQGHVMEILSNGKDTPLQKKNHLRNDNLPEVLPQDLEGSGILSCIEAALQTGETQETEYVLDTSAGNRGFEARFKACGKDEVVAFIRDITERKRYEEQLKHHSIYDRLTAIYNRAFFEEELARIGAGREFPVAIISVDLDGLKLINDTFGHGKGDDMLKSCACVLKGSLRESDVLARLGGDEFGVILPGTGKHLAAGIVARIKENIAGYNVEHPDIPLSTSIGLAVAENAETPLKEVYKRADDLMYRDKLMQVGSVRSQILTALMTTLAERDFLTEGHAQRLADLSLKIGEMAGLSAEQISNLKLLAQVHDLGKVGIPDNILNKKGKLNDEEWKVMKQHPEKGYRIAKSSSDLSLVAELILKHHEKWDGTGYPLSLAGEEIPVECRILSIVDAFDAMTNDRPYSKAISQQKALDEIKSCKGSQFDPHLTDLFLSLF